MWFSDYRKKLHYSQEKLSEISGVSLRTIQRVEAEEVDPTLDTFAKLIYALNIPDNEVKKYLEFYVKNNN